MQPASDSTKASMKRAIAFHRAQRAKAAKGEGRQPTSTGSTSTSRRTSFIDYWGGAPPPMFSNVFVFRGTCAPAALFSEPWGLELV